MCISSPGVALSFTSSIAGESRLKIREHFTILLHSCQLNGAVPVLSIGQTQAQSQIGRSNRISSGLPLFITHYCHQQECNSNKPLNIVMINRYVN